MKNFFIATFIFLSLVLTVVPVDVNAACPPACGDPGDITPPAGGDVGPPVRGDVDPPVGGDVRDDARVRADFTLFDPLGGLSVEGIFLAILDIIMVFAIPIILFFIVWSGFLYVTAQGDTTKIETATKALTYAVIGGVIVLGAQALLYVITNTIKLFG